jgi:hypothetical protein
MELPSATVTPVILLKQHCDAGDGVCLRLEGVQRSGRIAAWTTAKLKPSELEQVIKLVGRRSQAFPPVEWRPACPLRGSSRAMSTCAGRTLQDSASTPLRALLRDRRRN